MDRTGLTFHYRIKRVVIKGLTLPHRKVRLTNTVAADSVATVTLDRPRLVNLGLEHVVTLLEKAYTHKSWCRHFHLLPLML